MNKILALLSSPKQVLDVFGGLLISGHTVSLRSAGGFQDVGTFLSIVPDRLVEVLNGENGSDIVLPGGSDESVNALQQDGRKFIYHEYAGRFAGIVHL